jgi:hypothetical protein
VRRAAVWLAGARNSDGGYGFVPSAESDVDDTGAALQALAAAGRRGPASSEAVAYLRRLQNGDGGFGQSEGRDSNAQSTAWAVQGLLAARAGGDAVNRALAYLKRLQRRDGHIAYSRTSDQTPVWVTAQALIALRRKPFPLDSVPRARRKRRTAVAAGAEASGPPRRAPPARPSTRQPKAKPSAPARTRALDRIGPPRASGSPRRASAEQRSGGGPSPWLVLAACAGLLVLLALLRRALRHGRPSWLRSFSAGRS